MELFSMLGSGSSGNSAYLRTGDTGILIDAGLSCRRILDGIRQIGEEPRKIRGILITHEHIDHVRGLKILTKQLKVPVYAAPAVAESLRESGAAYDPWYVKDLDGEFGLGEVGVLPFPTSHDSADCRGFRFSLPSGLEIGYATDLGTVDKTVFSHLAGCKLVVLESNYDEGMLEAGPYPYSLKKRIKSAHGHLSNEECSDTLVKLASSGTRKMVLAHLSKDNNLPELARAFTVGSLMMAGIGEADYTLQVAKRDFPSAPILFSGQIAL